MMGMSALGQKQTYAAQQVMSALLPIATAKADICASSCPLYPRKRTCAVQRGMSALGQNGHRLLDHLLRGLRTGSAPHIGPILPVGARHVVGKNWYSRAGRLNCFHPPDTHARDSTGDCDRARAVRAFVEYGIYR